MPVDNSAGFKLPTLQGIGRSSGAPNDLKGIGWYFATSVLLGFLAAYMQSGTLKATATPLMWMLGCLSAGGAVGFLFGIPKILQGAEGPVQASDGAKAAVTHAYRQQVNTNLTEISDWLTKIIVGLGLINLAQIPGYVGAAGDLLGTAMGGAKPFALGLIVTFTILGFLFGYLATRLFLAGAFSRADMNAISNDRLAAQGAQLESLEVSQAVLKESLLPDDASEAPRVPTAEGGAPKAALTTPASHDGTDAGAGAAVAVAESKVPVTTEDAAVDGATEEARAVDRAFKAFSPQGEFSVLRGNAASALANLRRRGEEYMAIESPNYTDRVRAKNASVSKMASHIARNSLSREQVEKLIQETGNEGIVAGLATAINTFPQDGDFEVLLRIGRDLRRLHVRYRVILAMGELIRRGGVSEATLREASAYLKQALVGADPSLERLIRDTQAQIEGRGGQ